MRSYDECTAEVFRRSKVRIQRRKKMIIGTVSLCIPLVLCLCVGSVLLRATKSYDNRTPESAGYESVIDSNSKESANGGNTEDGNGISTAQLYIFIQGNEYAVPSSYAQETVQILLSADYSPHKVCRCLPQYQFVYQGEKYGIHLDEGYIRCSKGQAALSAEQLAFLRSLLAELPVS